MQRYELNGIPQALGVLMKLKKHRIFSFAASYKTISATRRNLFRHVMQPFQAR